MLRLHGVEAGYGQAGVLRGLSFGVDEGEVVVLLGRNGMGKTSTMRAVMGWENPQVTDGSIMFEGEELRGAPPHKVAAAGLGYVPQGRLIFPSLDVEEHLVVATRQARDGHPAWTLERVFELFPKLAERRAQRASTLSGGEQQMLVIGRALMTNPRILLLDEPSEGLAPLIVRQVGETIAELRREGMSILVAEQDVRFAMGLADRVLVLERGRVVAEGTPEQIDGDDELKRRHLGVETATSSAGATPELTQSSNGQPARARVGVALDRRAGRRPGSARVAPSEVTSVTTLLGGGQPWDRRLFSNGWSDTAAEPHTIVEPATGLILGEVAVAGNAEVARAAASAREAQGAWTERPAAERAEVVAAALGLLGTHADEVADWLIREGGATRDEARSEIEAASQQLRIATALATQPAGELLHATVPGGIAMQQRAPVGVVGAITPFGSPLALAARAVGAALVLGNAVLLKPDIRTAVSGGLALARILEEAGLPHGLLHVLPGGAASAQAMVTDRRVDAISFAGSRRAAQHVAAFAGQHLTPVSLHLGGPNTFVVLDDTDVDAAIAAGVQTSFARQGQRCTAASRHLVHASVAREYVDRLSTHVATLRIGDPYSDPDVDVGPLIDASRARQVASIVEATVAAGARHRAGGTRSGAYYPPTVITEVTPRMAAFTHEVLGPVVSVTTFETDEEVVALVGDVPSSPSAVIHTASSDRGFALGRSLRTSRVCVNGVPADDEGPDLDVITRKQRLTDDRRR